MDANNSDIVRIEVLRNTDNISHTLDFFSSPSLKAGSSLFFSIS
jgi:hypothetical protein